MQKVMLKVEPFPTGKVLSTASDHAGNWAFVHWDDGGESWHQKKFLRTIRSRAKKRRSLRLQK